MNIVILGLSITSSWGNGHATTYRGLMRELVARGHDVLFLERDMPWYRTNRDLPDPPYGRTCLYTDLDELRREFGDAVRNADLVMQGSFVPQGVEVAQWVLETTTSVTVFYDIDTPVTLSKLAAGDFEYLAPELIPQFDLYLSFTGGPMLDRLARDYGARNVEPLYCSVDPQMYYPEPTGPRWDLGYLGTYSADRQPMLERLMLAAASTWPTGHFVVAGPLYPADIDWPTNIARMEHLAPSEHRAFYNAQRFTLSVTRAAMMESGFSPSVRLFEAAACGVPIISDEWPGLQEFFTPGEEILVAHDARDTLEYLVGMPEETRIRISERARERVLGEHTAAHRAATLESYAFKYRHGPSHHILAAEEASRKGAS